MSVDRIDVPVESFDVRSSDGLRLRVHRAGSGPHRWLLVPGLGTPLLVWKYIIEAFADRMTIVTWDQRGLYGSEAPARPFDGDLAVRRHVDDAEAILDHLGWCGPYVTGSWSMGVATGLELYRRRPDQVTGLALINGPFEHVFRRAYGPAFTAPLIRGIVRGLVRGSPLLGPLVDPFFGSGLAGRLMDRLGVSTANGEFVVAVTKRVGEVDLGNYMQILLELDRHSSRDVLPTVRVPALVTAGARDDAAPPAVVKELHRLLPGSTYVEFPRGTHYTPMEYPQELVEALDRFFRAEVFPDTW